MSERHWARCPKLLRSCARFEESREAGRAGRELVQAVGAGAPVDIGWSGGASGSTEMRLRIRNPESFRGQRDELYR